MSSSISDEAIGAFRLRRNEYMSLGTPPRGSDLGFEADREGLAAAAPLLVSAEAEPAECSCYPSGFTYETFEGLQPWCDAHGLPSAAYEAGLAESKREVEQLRAELAETTRFKDNLHEIVRAVARIVRRSPNDDGGYLYADVPAMVERELAALRAAGGQKKPSDAQTKVREMHGFVGADGEMGICAECNVIWPCRTAAAVSGELTPSAEATPPSDRL